jgi:hypothetical protein
VRKPAELASRAVIYLMFAHLADCQLWRYPGFPRKLREYDIEIQDPLPVDDWRILSDASTFSTRWQIPFRPLQIADPQNETRA